MSGIDRLDERRETAFVELAKTLSENTRFAKWFPRNPIRRDGLRAQHFFKSFPATTERFLKLPLNRMRQKLNEVFQV